RALRSRLIARPCSSTFSIRAKPVTATGPTAAPPSPVPPPSSSPKTMAERSAPEPPDTTRTGPLPRRGLAALLCLWHEALLQAPTPARTSRPPAANPLVLPCILPALNRLWLLIARHICTIDQICLGLHIHLKAYTM